MNRLYLIGNLTADAVLAATASGMSVCTFSLAVNEPGGKQADGAGNVTYLRCSLGGGQGEEAARMLKKGNKVFVCGEVHASAYRGRDGSTRASLEVQCREYELLSGNAPTA